MNQTEIDSAIALANQGRLPQALALCLDAARRDDRDHTALFLAGHIQLRSSDLAAAERSLRAALDLGDSPLYFLALADCLRKDGRLEEGLATLGRAIAAHPGDRSLRETLESALCEIELRDEIAGLPDPAALQCTPSVTFETKVWEADWRIITGSGRLEAMIEQCAFSFTERVLVINNVEDRAAVTREAERLVASGVLTRHLDVREHEAETLDFFGLSADDLGKGYVYSIAELVSAHRTTTDYLLHFAGDSMMAERCDWITPALRAFSAHPRFAVANPVWGAGTPDLRGARQESFAEYGDFHVGFGFSDQCYLMRRADLQSDIYRFTHPAGRRYPAYGGELFEKRVDAWMRTHRRLRLTHKGSSYIHRNIR